MIRLRRRSHNITRKLQDMIETIPDDGCVLVFNAPYSVTRAAVSNVGAGILSCHTLESGYVNRELVGQETRDLYIRWRDQ